MLLWGEQDELGCSVLSWHVNHVFLNGVGKEIDSSEEVAVRLSLRDAAESPSHQGGNACSSLEQLEWTAFVSNNRAEPLKRTVTVLDSPNYLYLSSHFELPSPFFHLLLCLTIILLFVLCRLAGGCKQWMHTCVWVLFYTCVHIGYVSMHLCKHTDCTHFSFHVYPAPRLLLSDWATGSCSRIKSEESTSRRQRVPYGSWFWLVPNLYLYLYVCIKCFSWPRLHDVDGWTWF